MSLARHAYGDADAIGPADTEEAQKIWSRLSTGEKTLRELVDDYEPIAEGEEPRVFQIARLLSAKLDDETSFVVAALMLLCVCLALTR